MCSMPTVKIVRLLLQYGANVNTKSACQFGFTQFHLAIVNHHKCLDLIDLFFPYVTDINIYDHEGNTPLHWAMPMSVR
jgi:ankyrin repeat protein